MSPKGYTDELDRAMGRPDAPQLCRHFDAYAAYVSNGSRGDWPEEHAEALEHIIFRYEDDPERSFAFVILGAARSDDAKVLSMLGCGPLEDVLRNPSEALLDRIVAEARKSARFRWLLSNPFKIAIAPRAWEAIEKFRVTGPHEEAPFNALPARN